MSVEAIVLNLLPSCFLFTAYHVNCRVGQREKEQQMDSPLGPFQVVDTAWPLHVPVDISYVNVLMHENRDPKGYFILLLTVIGCYSIIHR